MVYYSKQDKLIIEYAIKFVSKFVGMKYILHNNHDPSPSIYKDEPPFWVGIESLPTYSNIYINGSCCAGLINLVRRSVGLKIPGNINEKKYEFVGGTCAWFKYLSETGRLEKINHWKVYPKGTLLIQDFNLIDQGHLAMTTTSNPRGLFNSMIIHSVNSKKDTKGKQYNGVIIERFRDYNIDTADKPLYSRFTHVCYPNNWLLKN